MLVYNYEPRSRILKPRQFLNQLENEFFELLKFRFPLNMRQCHTHLLQVIQPYYMPIFQQAGYFRVRMNRLHNSLLVHLMSHWFIFERFLIG